MDVESMTEKLFKFNAHCFLNNCYFFDNKITFWIKIDHKDDDKKMHLINEEN